MMPGEPAPYIGRFAPSPTGPLHLGSLVAAVASYLQAKINGGRWLLRVEDVDPPREQAGASEAIITALHQHGFEWHGDVIYQSQSSASHEAALDVLKSNQLTYRCRCSRRELADLPKGPLGTIYPGYCRSGNGAADATESAIRVLTSDSEIAFEDALQGPVAQRLESESGDFVVRRRDRLVAYHLAVVVDDEIQGVTEIVRGIDLMDSTPRQIWLQNLLGFRTPAYMHIPVITHADGDKLSKLTGAPGISNTTVADNLTFSLSLLKQAPPAELAQLSVDEIWAWAVKNWQPGQLFGCRSIVNTP